MAKNAPPVGCPPAGGAFCAAYKHNDCASKSKNAYRDLMHHLKIDFRKLKGVKERLLVFNETSLYRRYGHGIIKAK